MSAYNYRVSIHILVFYHNVVITLVILGDAEYTRIEMSLPVSPAYCDYSYLYSILVNIT